MPLADLGDGHQIYFRDRGEGPPCLGIMGFALDHRMWGIAVPAVTETHRFITFDNRGIGQSTGGAVTSIDEMSNDAVRLLDHLEIEKTVVFGVSMGGAIAQRLVVDHPERVSALILGITFARPIEFMRRQHVLARKLIEEFGAEVLEATLVRMFTPEFFEMGREAVDQLVASFVADEEQLPDPAVLLGQLDALDKHDVLDELKNVSVPTLVFGSDMDQMVPGFASREIADAIPGAQLEMFHSGHGVQVEKMDEVNAVISKFLASLV